MVSKPNSKSKLTAAQVEANHRLLSKADIAEMLDISSQLLANKAARAAEKGEYFPEPTYSNESGTVSLYTVEDAKEVYEYVTKAERERLQKAEKAFAKFGLAMSDGTPVEEPKLDLAASDPAPKAEEPKVEAPKVPEKPAQKPAGNKAAEKPAQKPADKPVAKSDEKPVTVNDAKAPEVKADAAKTTPAKGAATGTGTPAKVGTGAAFGLSSN